VSLLRGMEPARGGVPGGRARPILLATSGCRSPRETGVQYALGGGQVLSGPTVARGVPTQLLLAEPPGRDADDPRAEAAHAGLLTKAVVDTAAAIVGVANDSDS